MKISILTPTYNCGSFIEKCILSVIEQDYEDFEHIIIDGESTDNTLDIIKKYSHLKWISKKDKGQCDAMNKAFDLSTGEIIVYCNGDDYFEPGIFKYVINVFKSNPDYQMIVGNLKNKFINYDGEFITVPEIDFNKVILPFKYSFPYNPVSYFYKKEVQQKIGKFPIEEHYAMDYWFLIRAFDKNEVYKSHKVFGTFLRTGQNKTNESTIRKNPTFKIAYKYCKQKGVKSRFYYITNRLIFDTKKITSNYIAPVIILILYFLGLNQKFDLSTLKKFGVKKTLSLILKNQDATS